MKKVKLKNLCKQVRKELEERDYSVIYIKKALAEWAKLEQWCTEEQRQNITPALCNRYLDETYGSHTLPEGRMQSEIRMQYRYIRLLASYMELGDFEFRTKKVDPAFTGEYSQYADEYLNHCITVLNNKAPTLEYKRLRLKQFLGYIGKEGIKLQNLDTVTIDDFINSLDICIEAKNDTRSIIRKFLSLCYENGYTERNMAGYVGAPIRVSKPEKIVDVYTDDEIRRIIQCAPRTSAKHKRDYVIILLAASYGMMSGDIRTLRLSQIDWDRNLIKMKQSKTGEYLELPLLASVGNAIIDYLQNGRPRNCDHDIIVVSHMQGTVGKPLQSETIHSVISGAMQNAKIENWKNKKHGGHSLRHSLATNLLKKNTSMPVISTILGHRSTETTRSYLSVDIEKLRHCILPMPPLRSPLYRETGEVQND